MQEHHGRNVGVGHQHVRRVRPVAGGAEGESAMHRELPSAEPDQGPARDGSAEQNDSRYGDGQSKHETGHSRQAAGGGRVRGDTHGSLARDGGGAALRHAITVEQLCGALLSPRVRRRVART